MEAILRIFAEAFLLNNETTSAVSEAFADRRMAKSRTGVHQGGLPGAMKYYGSNETPELILVESADETDTILAQIEELAEVCDANTKVIVVGNRNDVSLYRGLSRKGVSDYVVAPVTARQIYDVIEAVCIDPDMPVLGRTISFVGARGGVGSSCLAHNVAWALGELMQDDVILLDMDITFGTAGLAFNLESRQGLDSLLADPDRLDEQLLERYMAEYDEHLKVLVSPANLDAQEGIVTGSLDALLQLVRMKAPYIVIDVPHRWAPWTKQVLVEADETVVCCVPDLASLRDTKNLVDRLKAQRGADAPVRIVLNHIGLSKKTELSSKDFENALGEEPTLSVPHDPALFGSAANNGQMLGEVNKRHKAVEAINQLATLLSGRQPPKKKKKGALAMFAKT